MDQLIMGVFVGAFVVLVMAFIAIRLTSKDYEPVQDELARNKAGGFDWDYTPDRAKH